MSQLAFIAYKVGIDIGPEKVYVVAYCIMKSICYLNGIRIAPPCAPNPLVSDVDINTLYLV